jgi:hypothetical protein
MNYTQLSSAIQAYTENTDTSFIAEIPVFVAQAEQRIYNSVQFPSLRKNMTGTVTSTTPYLSAPNDYLATYSLAVIDADGNYEYLLNKDVNFIRQAYPKASDTGLPRYYALFGPTVSGSTISTELSFMMGPKPDATYTVELHFFYYPESIVTASTSWVGNNFSSVLLYGSLLEAYTYMKGEKDVMMEYQKRYDDAMVLLKQLGDGKDRQDSYRSGQVRYPVQ